MVVIVGLIVWAAISGVALFTKKSWALKICKQEPQRTAPLAYSSWVLVMRKAVAHLGQRVTIWVIAVGVPY